MKIGILTMHAACNYGAVLQAYALQNYFEKTDVQAEIIDYIRPNQRAVSYLLHPSKKFKKSPIHQLAFILKSIGPRIKNSKVFSEFRKQSLHLSQRRYFGVEDLNSFPPEINCYCIGSDQVWNPTANNGMDDVYLLNLSGSSKAKKVSYSSSIGLVALDDPYIKQLGEALKDFSCVSVRERSGVEILQRAGRPDACCVLDPTLLLTFREWISFAQVAIASLPKEPYLLIYYFGNTAPIIGYAEKIATKKNLKIVRISVGNERYKGDQEVRRYISPEEFVALFSGAECVITNSFHGTAFSINFHKEFYAYPTTEKNARFDSILDIFSLQDRNIRSHTEINFCSSIDFQAVEAVLQEERDKSKSFIDKIISSNS